MTFNASGRVITKRCQVTALQNPSNPPKHNPGPKTEEGKLRQKMGSWKHGFCSKDAKLFRQARKLEINLYKQNLYQ